MNNPRPNPYIGPRAFRTGEVLYGRDREINDLFDLLIAERIVVLHSTPGAGKSSLVSAGMVPRLTDEGFHVLPVVRVSQERPIDLLKGNDTTGLLRQFNRYTFSSLLSLEEDLPLEKRTDLVHLARAHLDAYIDSIVLRKQSADKDGDKTSHVIIFDQFEETLTIDPNDREVKLAFFQQLGAALRNRNLWALIAIREDYLPSLEPYTRSIPTRLENTYRLDMLGVEAAHQAIEQPAQCAGVSFASEAASKLVDDLRRIQVQQPDGSMQEQPGLYVEPVQLQVVCYRLWQNLTADDIEIDSRDLATIGDVNESLADYYCNGIAEVAATTEVAEQAIRQWFDKQLITISGIRSQVLMQPERSNGLDNRAIWKLIDAHLVRAEKRRNATWFELAHDRLIRPVRQNNAAWFEAHLSLMQRQATLWEEKGRPDGLLLRAGALVDAEIWAAEQVGIPVEKLSQYLINIKTKADSESSRNLPLTNVEVEFLKNCLDARKVRQRERLRNRLIATLGVFALVLAVLSLFFWNQSNNNLKRAKSSAAEAQAASTAAFHQKATAEFASTQAVVNLRKAETSAIEAQKQNDIANIQKGVAESNSRLANSRRLIALSNGLAKNQLDASLLLGLEAFKISDNPDTRNNLSQQYLNFIDIQRYLSGSKGDVSALAFSPDGRTLASGGCQNYDILYFTCTKGEITLWNLDTGQPTPVENDQALGQIKSIEFSPDGKTLITIDESGQAAIWDVQKGQVLPEEQNRKSVYYVTAMNPDGSLISVYDAGVIKLFSLDQVNEKSFPADTIPITNLLSLSPDGKWIIYKNTDGETVLWNFGKTPSESVKLDPLPESDALISFSPDNRWLAWSDYDHQLILMDLHSPKSKPLKLSGHTDRITDIKFNPIGGTLVTGSTDGTVKIWKLNDLHSPATDLMNLQRPVAITKVVFSPDGKTLAVSSEDGKVSVWDSTTLQPTASVFNGPAGAVDSLAFSLDGKLLASGGCRQYYLTNCLSGEILIRNPTSTTIKPIPLPGHTDWVNNAIFSPDGKNLFTGSDDGRVILWDITNPAAGYNLGELSSEANDIRLIPDKKTLVIADGAGSILFWDYERQQLEDKRYDSSGSTFFSLALSTDYESLAAGDDEGYIHVFNSGDLSPRHEPLAIYNTPVLSLSFRPDGRYLVSGGKDGKISLLDLTTWQSRSFPVFIPGPVFQVVFSPDGQSLASTHNDGTAILWKLADDPMADPPEILGQLKGSNTNLNTIAYDPSGKMLVSGDESGKLIFWDLTTLQPSRPPINSNSGPIYRVNFSPDGSLLVSAHKTGAVNLWRIDTGPAATTSWEGFVCGIVNRNLTPDEFISFFPGETYRKICPSLP